MSRLPSFPETGGYDAHRYGVLIITRGDGKRLRACLGSILAYSHAPERVAIVDRGERRALEADDTSDLGLPVDYWWTGDDLGVAGSIEIGLRYLGGCEAVLLLDDFTELGSRDPELMLASLRGPVGAVVGQPGGSGLKKLTKLEPSRFNWFPLLLSLHVVNSVGAPRVELFAGYDDREYGLRISGHGYLIAYRPVESIRREGGEESPVDTYLLSRNLLYLLTRRRLWNISALKDWVHFAAIALRQSSHPKGASVRRGFSHGLKGRLGPPPPDLVSASKEQDGDTPAARHESG